MCKVLFIFHECYNLLRHDISYFRFLDDTTWHLMTLENLTTVSMAGVQRIYPTKLTMATSYNFFFIFIFDKIEFIKPI